MHYRTHCSIIIQTEQLSIWQPFHAWERSMVLILFPSWLLAVPDVCKNNFVVVVASSFILRLQRRNFWICLVEWSERNVRIMTKDQNGHDRRCTLNQTICMMSIFSILLCFVLIDSRFLVLPVSEPADKTQESYNNSRSLPKPAAWLGFEASRVWTRRFGVAFVALTLFQLQFQTNWALRGHGSVSYFE